MKYYEIEFRSKHEPNKPYILKASKRALAKYLIDYKIDDFQSITIYGRDNTHGKA